MSHPSKIKFLHYIISSHKNGKGFTLQSSGWGYSVDSDIYQYFTTSQGSLRNAGFKPGTPTSTVCYRYVTNESISHIWRNSVLWRHFFCCQKNFWIKNWMRTIAADYLFSNNFVVFTCSVQGKNFEIMRQQELCIKLKWFFKYYICIISESILFVEAHSRAWPKIYKNNKSELGVRFSFCATAPPAQCA